MRYNNARDLIKTGDVLACAGPWVFSKLIRTFTHDEVSHVGLACWLRFNGSDPRLCILESIEGTGVRIVPLFEQCISEYWKHKSGRIWWCQNLDKKLNGDKIFDFAYQHWCDGYVRDVQFPIIMFPILQSLRRKLGYNIEVNTGRWHCAQLVTQSYMSNGYNHPKPAILTNPGEVTRFSCFAPKVLLEPN